MKKLILSIPLLASFAVVAGVPADIPTGQALRLKDGNYVFVSEDGNMRMTDANGKPITMKDGVVMELQDGTEILMKGGRAWTSYNPKLRHGAK